MVDRLPFAGECEPVPPVSEEAIRLLLMALLKPRKRGEANRHLEYAGEALGQLKPYGESVTLAGV